MAIASSLRAHVHAATRALAGVRMLEALALAATAGSACFAAALLSGSIDGGRQALAAAALAGLCAGATWWCEHAPSAAAVARRLDRAQGQDGALVTAFERELDANPVANLLTQRVRATMSRAASLRAVMPRSAVLFALPLVGAATILLALESRRTQAAALERVLPRVEALLDGLDQIRDAAAAGDRTAVVADLAPVFASAADVRAALSPARPASIPGALRALEARLSEAAAAKGHDPRLVDALAELARLRRSFETARPSHEPDPAERDRTDPHAAFQERPARADDATGTQAGTAESPVGGESADRSATAIAGAGADGTIPSRGTSSAIMTETMPTTAQQDHSAGAAGTEVGVRGARWWPKRYDAVVERWIDERRELHNQAVGAR